MSEIDGVGPIHGPRPIGAATPTGAARAEQAAGVDGPSPAAAPDPMLAVFDRVAEALAAGHHSAPVEAVRAAVEAVLGESMPHLAPVTRERLSAQVTEALLEHPDLSARLDRLLNR